MFCQKCGTSSPEGSAFCQKCGAKLIVDDTTRQASLMKEEIKTNSESMVRKENVTANRGLLKLILFSMFTLGIYGLVFWYGMGRDINTIAGKHDGKKSMNFIVVLLLNPFTLGIALIVWVYNLCKRAAGELDRRNINGDNFRASAMLWILLPFIGGFVFCYKLIKAMNRLADNYNTGND